MSTISEAADPTRNVTRGICPDLSILRHYFTQSQIVALWHGQKQAEANLVVSRALVSRLVLALENARDVVHRTHCLPQPLKQCWKECEEAMDAMLEAGWMPLVDAKVQP